ncbi:MAG: hypothetical protein PHO02_03970 [Candidatus Nanoarchaeia archaeon]|nr:hypothetical protein [Candidatus Nanoarchaeia archaeon]
MKSGAKTSAIAVLIISLVLISASSAFAGITIPRELLLKMQMQKPAITQEIAIPIAAEYKYIDEFAIEKALAREDELKTEEPAPAVIIPGVKISIFKSFLRRHLGARVQIPPSASPAYPIELSIIDKTNPAFASVDIAKYQRFQSENRVLFSEMNWKSPASSASIIYSQQKMESLAHYIALLETGQEFPLTAPPEGTFLNITTSGHITRLYTEEEALQMYLPHIAMSLYIEVNHLVPWSILGYNEYQRSFLLDGRKFINYDSERNGYRFYIDYKSGGGYQGVTNWNPFAVYQFLQDNSMIQPTQQDTIYSLTEWMRANLVHEAAASQFRNREIYGYPGYYPVEKILNPPEGARHWTQGCYGTASLYKALLNAVNVPVSINMTLGGHKAPLFVTANLALGHGDDPYSTYNKKAPQEVPVERIFMTIDEFYEMNHAAEDDRTHPNNADVASWLNARKHSSNAYEFKAYSLLEKRGFDALYPHIGAQTLQYWWTSEHYAPLYDNDTIEEMISNIDAEITRIGEGNYTEGYRRISRAIVRAS